jgi:hypothetical protein
MVSRSVPEGSIGITTSPSEDGSTVNTQITGTGESPPERLQNGQHKK